MIAAELQYVLQNRLLHCFWFYRKSCQICQSKVNQFGTYVGTRFCSPVKSLSNSMTHHTCPKKGKTNPSTFHPSQFCHSANKYFTTVYTVHVDCVQKGQKRRESNKRRCFEMERNPLKGGQACGGDGHLKGSKQLCQGFDQHQVQV